MNIPPPLPPPGGNSSGAGKHQLVLSSEDDFCYHSSLFHDSNSGGGGGAFTLEMPVSGKRRKRGMEDDDDKDTPWREQGSQEAENSGTRKRATIAQLPTSLVGMEKQEKAEQFDAEVAALQDAGHGGQAMIDYLFDLQDGFSDTDEPDKHKRITAAGGRTTTNGSPGSRHTGGQQQQHHHQQHQRRLWVKDRSRAWWDRCNHPDFPEEKFRAAFRMGRATFDMLCDELGSAVAKEDTTLRAAIPVRQRVAVCIWRLATGDPLRLVSKRFGLGISTCHKLILEVCSAIKTLLMPKLLQWPSHPDAIHAIHSTFESSSKIPNIIGSMYTTHIPIIAPKTSVAAYFNKRHTERNQKTSYSVTVQGVVDPDGVFTDVCIGWPGSMPDEQVLDKSALSQRAAAGILKEHQWVVGSAGHPLLDWVLVPYAHLNLTWTQHAFNGKVGEVQRVAREAFARLKGRWKCLQRRTEVKLQDLPVVLGACCVLHNLCELSGEEMDPELRFELVDDEMMPENPVRSAEAMRARDDIAHNLLHHGLAGTTFFLQ